MKIENQVCSLELAKELKELGVPQESHFYWCKDLLQGWILENKREAKCYRESLDGIGAIAAPTVAELGEMLHKYGGFISYGDGIQTIDRNCEIKADTEADARAKMLIYLIKQGIVKVKDL